MSQHNWTTQAIQDGFQITERYGNIAWYIGFSLSIPVICVAHEWLYRGQYPPRQRKQLLYALTVEVPGMAQFLVEVIASSGLRYAVPGTNLGFTLLEPGQVLPNQCTPELHQVKLDAWPCVRDGALQYLQRITGPDGRQHVFDPEAKYFLYFLAFFGLCLGFVGAHYLERYVERTTRAEDLGLDNTDARGLELHGAEAMAAQQVKDEKKAEDCTELPVGKA